jgi:hypothetical protein
MISSILIFILFYINISMLWIKIDFYKLIWLNENIKKKKFVIFRTCQTLKNVFGENLFLEKS